MLPKTKQEAREIGSLRYLGKPCKAGHHSGRFLGNGGCVECHRVVTRKAAAILQSSNPNKKRADRRTWYAKHRDEQVKRVAVYTKANRPAKYAANAKRRAAKYQRSFPGFDTEIKEIYASRSEGHAVDHIYPLHGKNSCGLHVPWNLQVIPALENQRKGNKDPETFYEISSLELHSLLDY